MSFIILFLIAALILLIITVVKVNKNSNRIVEMEWELRRIRKLMDSDKKTLPIKFTSERKDKSEEIKPSIPIQSEGTGEISFDKLSESFPGEAVQDIVTEKKSMTKNEWEILIGGKVLNRIGAVAIIIGVSFFLKYAFDNDWISESFRVIIGVVIGFIFIAGGLRSYKKDYKIFSQGLSGTGISILYLSVYASFNYYYLISQPLAFVLMAGVTVLTFSQAFYFNSMAVSLIGLLGGFITPFLLSTGHSNEVGLFTYLAVLNVGLIMVAMKKSEWMILESLAVAATYIIYYAWYIEYFDQDKSAVSLLFLTIFWGIFFLTNIIHILNSSRLNLELRLVTAASNLFLYSVGMYIIIDNVYNDWIGAAAIVLSVIHFAFYYFILKKRSFFEYELNFALLSSIILFSLFIYFQFSDFMIIILWSVNLLLLTWLGIKYKINLLLFSGIILTILTLVKLLATDGALSYEPLKEFNLILTLRTLSYIVLSLTLGLSAYFISKGDHKNTFRISSGYLYLLCTVFFIFLTVETNDYFRKLHLYNQALDVEIIRFWELLSWAGIWVYYSLILVFIGYRKNILELIICSICALGLGSLLAVIIGISYLPIEEFELAINFRALILTLILIGTSAHIFLLRNKQNLYDWLEDFYKILQVTLVILILALITGEVKDYYNREIFLLNSNSSDYSEMLSKLENLQQMLLSSSWLVVSSILIVIGIWKKNQVIRVTAIILFGIAILKIFIYDLSYLETIYRIISFIGLGLILLAASFVYQKYKKFLFD